MCEIEPRMNRRVGTRRQRFGLKALAKQTPAWRACSGETSSAWVFGCAGIVYAWLASVHASLRFSGGSVRDNRAHLLSHNQEKSCMSTKAALAPLDLEDGVVGYDAVLAEIK